MSDLGLLEMQLAEFYDAGILCSLVVAIVVVLTLIWKLKSNAKN